MKKNSKTGRAMNTSSNNAAKQTGPAARTAGVDLGDRGSHYAIVNADGVVIEEGELVNTPAGLGKVFAAETPMRIALETGAQSGWIARTLAAWGHEVLVANARELRGIWGGPRKNDRRDAEKLARYARLDPALLAPTRVRSEASQIELSQLRARDALVRARTLLINAARGMAKTHGERLAKSSTKAFAERAAAQLSESLSVVLQPLLEQIAVLSARIVELDRVLKQAAEQDPNAARLMTVKGVGPLTALTFVHTIEDPHRFARFARRRGVPGTGATASAIGRARSATADQQDRRRTLAALAGAVRASHLGAVRRGLIVATMGSTVGRTRRSERT